MAITQLAPQTDERPDDLVDCDTAARMLEETPYPVPASTLRRLLRSADVRTWTVQGLRGRPRKLVSFSALLDLHAARYADIEPDG